MADDSLPKRAAELGEKGRRRRGRPRLRWEDCVKIDAKKTGEEGYWRTKTGDRESRLTWRHLASVHPAKCGVVMLEDNRRRFATYSHTKICYVKLSHLFKIITII